MKTHINLISSEDDALLDVIEIDEKLCRQLQQKISCYGITLEECFALWIRALHALRKDELKSYLSELAANNRVWTDTCFCIGSGKGDPILTNFNH